MNDYNDYFLIFYTFLALSLSLYHFLSLILSPYHTYKVRRMLLVHVRNNSLEANLSTLSILRSRWSRMKEKKINVSRTDLICAILLTKTLFLFTEVAFLDDFCVGLFYSSTYLFKCKAQAINSLCFYYDLLEE